MALKRQLALSVLLTLSKRMCQQSELATAPLLAAPLKLEEAVRGRNELIRLSI
jgi:hypothetical protein